jgi:hypothetical protein
MNPEKKYVQITLNEEEYQKLLTLIGDYSITTRQLFFELILDYIDRERPPLTFTALPKRNAPRINNVAAYIA